LLAESTDTYSGKILDLKIMEEPTVRTLGMGAGGEVVQNIEPDRNDPRMWDVANSKLLNIHLIDSRTFKLVSNIDPPQKPITPEQYHEMGLPFYQLQPEKSKGTKVLDKKNDIGSRFWGSILGSKEVAIKNLKQSHQTLPNNDEGYISVESGQWGLLDSGLWGRIGKGPSTDGYKDTSFDFPVALLDVDDTIPKFKSVGEIDDEWEEDF